jgi:peptidoglycan/LPS O-acetylase OafA/YrhL
MTRLEYSASLDGLRGLAVLAVMGSHFGIPGLAGGGFVGVTLFFVLSGYLITSLLAAELQAAGRIRIRAFYGRRAARLFPALALLLIVVGTALVVDGHAGTAMAGIASSALYVSNVATAEGAVLGPLEHTWSLSIEEQFYLAWPAAIIAGLTRRRVLVVGILVVIAVAAALRVILAGDPWWTYHFTLTRIDGILVGCLLALVPLRPTIALTVSAAVFLVMALVLPLDPAFVLEVTLLPIAVAGGILVSARPGVLGVRPLVAVGKISYGLYLWHFPLGSILPPIAAIPATFAIATLSYMLLEQPVRRAAARRWSAHLVLGLVAGRPSVPVGSGGPGAAKSPARPAGPA